jgi:hypothetical protein
MLRPFSLVWLLILLLGPVALLAQDDPVSVPDLRVHLKISSECA